MTLANLTVPIGTLYFPNYFSIMLYPNGVDHNMGGQLRCNRDIAKTTNVNTKEIYFGHAKANLVLFMVLPSIHSELSLNCPLS